MNIYRFEIKYYENDEISTEYGVAETFIDAACLVNNNLTSGEYIINAEQVSGDEDFVWVGELEGGD